MCHVLIPKGQMRRRDSIPEEGSPPRRKPRSYRSPIPSTRKRMSEGRPRRPPQTLGAEGLRSWSLRHEQQVAYPETCLPKDDLFGACFKITTSTAFSDRFRSRLSFGLVRGPHCGPPSLELLLQDRLSTGDYFPDPDFCLFVFAKLKSRKRNQQGLT